MIPIARPMIDNAEIDAVSQVLISGNIAEGNKVAHFEKVFREYAGVNHAIAVNSGTSALHIALNAAGIGPGDEVITSSFSFIATANSIVYSGSRPIFADILHNTFTINPDDVLNKITPRTKAILPVHLYGHPAEMGALQDIAEDYNFVIIEDACQAHGAEYFGKKVGSFGIGTFSFYPTKNMTTGEGGMITTNNSNYDTNARMLRSHGSRQRYYHETLGFNYRMSDIYAAIGIAQLEKLESFNQKRRENARYLSAGLRNLTGIEIPITSKGFTHVFHQYTIRVTDECTIDRNSLIEKLKERGIETGLYYPIPIHKQPFYRELGYNDVLEQTEIAAKQVISLPVHPGLSHEDLDYIINTIGVLIK